MIPDYDFTVANTITVAVAIYKNNLRQFLKLSVAAHLWLLIPVYGWARYFAIAAWISKLSFQKLDSSLNNAELKYFFSLKSMLVFLTTGIAAMVIPALLSFVILLCVVILFSLLEQLVSFTILKPLTTYLNSIEDDTLKSLLGLFGLFFLPTVSAGFYARFFISDLIFIENSKEESVVINLIMKSYVHTKKITWKIFKIIIHSFIITFPIWSIAYFSVSLLLAIITAPVSSNYVGNSFIISAIGAIFYLSNILTMPFWQSIKAVTYYDLTKKEDWNIRANHQE